MGRDNAGLITAAPSFMTGCASTFIKGFRDNTETNVEWHS